MFGIGGFELFIILIFGFLIFGPDKLPEIAKTVGKGIARFREAQQEVNDVIGDEKLIDLDNPDEPIKDPMETLDRIAKRHEEKKAEAKGAAAPAKAAASTKAATSDKAEASAGADKSGGESKQESFTERKARYERERAARKAAEAEAAKKPPVEEMPPVGEGLPAEKEPQAEAEPASGDAVARDESEPSVEGGDA